MPAPPSEETPMDSEEDNEPVTFKVIQKLTGKLAQKIRTLAADEENPMSSKDFKRLDLFKKALAQKRNDRDKIYSLHEPHTKCISKGKEHKKYEFGNKASIAKTISGVIVGAMGFRNEFDGHTLKPALEQVAKLTGKQPKQFKMLSLGF